VSLNDVSKKETTSMSNKISQLTDNRNALLATATGLVQRGLNTPTAREEYKRILAESDEIQETLDLLNRIERHLPSLPQVSTPVAVPRSNGEQSTERRAKMNAAWRALLFAHLDSRIPEHRDLLTSSDSGATVGTEFNDFSVAALKNYAPLMQFVRRRVSDNGRAVHSSLVTDTGNGMSYVPEGNAVPEVDPSGFSSTLISTDTLSAGIQKYSVQLSEDSAFDLTEFLTGLSAVRFGRGIERALTLGTDQSGTSLPNNPGLVNIASVGVTTASLAANVTLPNIADLYESLDSAYYPRAVWQMNAATRISLIKTLGTDNRSLFVPAPSADGLDLLFGHPLLINSSLPNLGTANVIPILFGDLYNGLEVVGSLPKIITLVERYIDSFERGLILHSYVGSAALASGAIKAIKLAAS
jgi:HK97 family phage major capsid protein